MLLIAIQQRNPPRPAGTGMNANRGPSLSPRGSGGVGMLVMIMAALQVNDSWFWTSPASSCNTTLLLVQGSLLVDGIVNKSSENKARE